ncbi:FIST signal transduction protein [Gloeocapsopsis dulcis]|uniref:Histidine kinase n=1 Tax=Gloeocapsopsis dulcis AAB1 = 1H9 TaxID=1433147 RepID=A0A6N8FYX3_9CHRO|nr:FIST N-terminal domain-containing protein [Gloeocapsopsis dulcis]MUL37535.1 hypothetical protein [Gloeocapsopsis dulcis AAB1 = 1H9]WNN87949.1 FIST C-terminal domain-containing protein [Gloeocapsopsis dulcis]
MADLMQWANAVSTRASLEAAVAEVVEKASTLLQLPADLGLIFISAAFTSEYPRLPHLLQEKLPDVKVLIGCGGGGIVGANQQGTVQEFEGVPALSLTLAHLPGVEIKPFHVLAEQFPDLDSPPTAWVDLLGVSPTEQPQFILLSDPFSSGVSDLLQGIDYAYPGSITVGGLASGSQIPGRIGLLCNDTLYRSGTVGVALSGNIVLDTIVAQGCRPIGEPYRVSASERNILLALEEQPPLEVLRDLISSLNDSDRQLAEHSLFIGVVRDEFKQNLEQGDFLIRNLLGVDPKVGAIAVADLIRPGQRIQFHLRDAETSADDLEWLLQRYLQTHPDSSPAGALMFSCMGRGEMLYGKPNFDSQLFSSYMPDVSMGGFFCSGEIGPVSGSTFLHGYTSVFAICRQP